MAFVEHIEHEKCGSSDGLAVYSDDEGLINSYCWACGDFEPDPYKNRAAIPVHKKITKTQEQIDAELNEILAYGTVALPSRSLTQESLEYFGVKIGMSEYDGVTPMFRFYPYRKKGEITGYKVKMVPEKRMWSVGKLKGVGLFGMERALETGAKKLFITEGEDDAVALYQALRAKQHGSAWEHLQPAVVSIPHGAKHAKKSITENSQLITSNFKEVILVFDNDEDGKAAEREVLQVLPRASTVTLPGNDPNDCVMMGKSLALSNAVLFKAATPKNTRIVWGNELFESSKEVPQYGLSWPWEGLTKLTRGIRFGETYYLGAGVKMGKSEFVNAVGAHLIEEHGLKIFMAKPEEANKKTIKLFLGKIAGKFFHDPDKEFDGNAYDDAAKVVGRNLGLLNIYQHMGWESLRQDIIEAVGAGCKAVFIDPITNLTNGVASGAANTQLQEISQELASMALDLDIVIFIFCHLNNPESGDSHQRGGKVLSHQFAGSRAMMRSCNLMLGLEGDRDPDLDKEERNMRKLVVLEDREFGASGFVWLYWDDTTGLFKEIRHE